MLSPPIPSPSREVPDPSAAPPCSRRCQVCSPHPPPPSPCHLIPQPASKHNPFMSFRGGDTCAGNRPGQSCPSYPAILQALHPIRPPSLELPPRSIWEQGSRSLQPFEGRLCESSLRMLDSKEKMLLSEFLYSGSQNSNLCNLRQGMVKWRRTPHAITVYPGHLMIPGWKGRLSLDLSCA